MMKFVFRKFPLTAIDGYDALMIGIKLVPETYEITGDEYYETEAISELDAVLTMSMVGMVGGAPAGELIRELCRFYYTPTQTNIDEQYTSYAESVGLNIMRLPIVEE